MSRRVALVTDSTASLSPSTAAEREIVVIPLQVVVGSRSYDEGGPEVAPEIVAEALRAFTPVSTSRPSPAVFAETFAAAAEHGAEAVLSVHLSGELSGTYESALLAAREAPVPVTVVDSRVLGMGTGFAVLEAAGVLDAGGTVDEAADAVRRRAGATTSLFYVDTLEYLRRGGRIGAAAAVLGSALAVKPLLHLHEGRVGMLEKVRTSGRALKRLEELALAAAGDRPVDVAVAHLANPTPAEQLAEHLRERLAAQLEGRPVEVGEVGAVIGAHVGPGMVAVVISPR